MPNAIAVANSPVLLSPSPTPTTVSSFFCKQASNRNNVIEVKPVVCSTSTSMLLKRKRPERIMIPIVSLSFNQSVAARSPIEVDRLDEVDVEGEGYSCFSKRGKRGPMEDRYSAIINSKHAFFGVYDGHGGAKAAEFAADNMGNNIINEVDLRSGEGLEEAVSEGYLTTDANFLEQNENGGCSCVTVLICNRNLIVSNAGDCRAVMSRGGVAEARTVDHRPSNQDERKRIQSLGGYVDCCRGVWRIQGSLAVSRGIGDSHLKRWVIAEPETRTLMIEPECEFLILASDGLWDKVSNQEAVEVARPLCIGVGNPKLSSACKKVVDMAIMRGSSDDISVMVILLGHFAQ